jgi:two-component system, NarL family, nitrate/nitrite response regulator NarL
VHSRDGMENSGLIRIVIADDHTIFRDGLKILLGSEPEFDVVGEAGNGSEALKLVEELQPDVLLLDLLMPKTSGMEVLVSLAESQNKVRTILLSGVAEGDDISRIFELGARGLVLKDSATSMLFKSIRAVMAGQYWIGRQSVSSLVQTLKHYKNSSTNKKPKNYGLTPREMEIVRAVVSGYPNKEIATRFSISEQTVKHHITNIFDKLGVYNRLELTLFAFHHGIVEK